MYKQYDMKQTVFTGNYPLFIVFHTSWSLLVLHILKMWKMMRKLFVLLLTQKDSTATCSDVVPAALKFHQKRLNPTSDSESLFIVKTALWDLRFLYKLLVSCFFLLMRTFTQDLWVWFLLVCLIKSWLLSK